MKKQTPRKESIQMRIDHFYYSWLSFLQGFDFLRLAFMTRVSVVGGYFTTVQDPP